MFCYRINFFGEGRADAEHCFRPRLYLCMPGVLHQIRVYPNLQSLKFLLDRSHFLLSIAFDHYLRGPPTLPIFKPIPGPLVVFCLLLDLDHSADDSVAHLCADFAFPHFQLTVHYE